MLFKKTIEKIRQKPQHVRERILLVSMAVFIPIILTVWYATFQFESHSSGISFFKGIGSTISNTLGSPTYKNTFGK